MCSVSVIMDTYRPHMPLQWPATRPDPDLFSAGELREFIDSFKQAVKAAEVFDRLTGQRDCVDPEKAQLQDRVAELERRLDEMAEAAQ